MTSVLEFFAPCPRGSEALLAEEVRGLRCKRVRPLTAGVSFAGPLEVGYRTLLWTRLASRVLLTLERIPAGNADELYAAVGELPWEEHVRAGGTLSVDATGVNDALRNTQFTAVRVKDAIADRFTELFGCRPSVDTVNPDLRVNIVIRSDRATISIDLSGKTLHRRGYREPGVQVEAPMKETLAAAVLAAAGWDHIAKKGGAFVDPMCGSGTLAIEAAMMAGDVAPGLLRTSWGFSAWLGHDEREWGKLIMEAERRREVGLSSLVPIFGFDIDGRAIEVARSCVRRAGLERHITLAQRPLSALSLSAMDVASTSAARIPGLIATNPPYGERINARSGLPALYAELSTRMREGFAGWTFAVITPDDSIDRGIGLTSLETSPLYNGRILSPVRVFHVPDAAGEPWVPPLVGGTLAIGSSSAEVGSELSAIVLEPASETFSNRLRKMAKHHEKWARKAGVTCYRVYDADLPDYAVAIDIYAGAGVDQGSRWVHVAEYAPPPGIDTALAERRLDDVLAIVPGVLEVAAEDVFLKVRQRQRGDSQYERVSRSGVVATVEEGGLLFEVNFTDYLDTGLFLDHRITRAMIRDLAAEKRFLNLFAYTGTASVYAADGGASYTTTVDLSATYVGWSERNMARNGFSGARHPRIQTDVLQWLDAAVATPGERFDLVFCDPPTFSNSKRMRETWDVQRDHVSLITRIGKLLAPGGQLVFSCNRRRFEMDLPALAAAGLYCKDVTARTIPRDFERRPGIHTCWIITHSEG